MPKPSFITLEKLINTFIIVLTVDIYKIVIDQKLNIWPQNILKNFYRDGQRTQLDPELNPYIVFYIITAISGMSHF